ncbi:hypothetical protein SETIT_1G175700v2 [Setaria italica]|uniref:Secreted protein n=2 Tax=Setaria italica TaxID=4555 RepID=K3YXC0_SETIT|nr:hypothetical protein SETIT_1G175700v2 [Setaria italica]RCV06598.1 hypothetical protein SETIT_1G175700v2 [Setaria italica]
MQLLVILEMPMACAAIRVSSGSKHWNSYYHHMNEVGKMKCAPKSFSLEEKQSEQDSCILDCFYLSYASRDTSKYK